MKRISVMLTGILIILMISCRENEKQIKNKQIMKSTEKEKDGVLHAIDLYVEAGRKGDSNIAKQAFASTATMSWNENGELKSVPIQVLYDVFDTGGPSEASYELTTVDIAEDAAIVRIESQFGTVKFADMFTLVKDNDKWKIISKIYHVK